MTSANPDEAHAAVAVSARRAAVEAAALGCPVQSHAREPIEKRASIKKAERQGAADSLATDEAARVGCVSHTAPPAKRQPRKPGCTGSLGALPSFGRSSDLRGLPYGARVVAGAAAAPTEPQNRIDAALERGPLSPNGDTRGAVFEGRGGHCGERRTGRSPVAFSRRSSSARHPNPVLADPEAAQAVGVVRESARYRTVAAPVATFTFTARAVDLRPLRRLRRVLSPQEICRSGIRGTRVHWARPPPAPFAARAGGVLARGRLSQQLNRSETPGRVAEPKEAPSLASAHWVRLVSGGASSFFGRRNAQP